MHTDVNGYSLIAITPAFNKTKCYEWHKISWKTRGNCRAVFFSSFVLLFTIKRSSEHRTLWGWGDTWRNASGHFHHSRLFSEWLPFGESHDHCAWWFKELQEYRGWQRHLFIHFPTTLGHLTVFVYPLSHYIRTLDCKVSGCVERLAAVSDCCFVTQLHLQKCLSVKVYWVNWTFGVLLAEAKARQRVMIVLSAVLYGFNIKRHILGEKSRLISPLHKSLFQSIVPHLL